MYIGLSRRITLTRHNESNWMRNRKGIEVILVLMIMKMTEHWEYVTRRWNERIFNGRSRVNQSVWLWSILRDIVQQHLELLVTVIIDAMPTKKCSSYK